MGSETLGCFQFLDRAVNLFWLEANLKCEEIGGYLAEPRTARYRKQTQLAYTTCHSCLN